MAHNEEWTEQLLQAAGHIEEPNTELSKIQLQFQHPSGQLLIAEDEYTCGLNVIGREPTGTFVDTLDTSRLGEYAANFIKKCEQHKLQEKFLKN